MRRRIIDVPGGRVAAVEFGPAARPLDVVFLHANGFNAMTYRAALAADLRVLAPDMRGHGRTDLPTHAEGHRWAAYAEDLLALLAALGEAPRVLAGHSMGAAAALLAASRLAAVNLVLFDPVIATPEQYASRAGAADWNQPLVKGALRRKAVFASRAEALAAYRGRGAFATWPDATLADYLEGGLRELPNGSLTLACAPAWEAANFAAFATSDPHAGLGGAGGAVRILRAEHGSTCALTDRDAAAHGVQLETVPDTTHFLPMERPEMVREALRAA